jgi:alpha-L-rhamnosidase
MVSYIKSKAFLAAIIMLSFVNHAFTQAKQFLPIPDKLIVLTFDDGNISDYAYTAPLLKKYGFGATFFITSNSFLGSPGKDSRRMTWQQIKELDTEGFEIGNHSTTHPRFIGLSEVQTVDELEGAERAFREHGITKPVSFAFPGFHLTDDHNSVFEQKGYKFLRRGFDPEYPLIESSMVPRGSVYEPGKDHPYAIPTTLSFGLGVGIDDLAWAVDQARDGKISVLTFHGIPDVHPHCTVSPQQFAIYMQYIHDQGCTVIAMRDLDKYIDPSHKPIDVFGAIYSRLGLHPADLKCEYAHEPIGVDVKQPRFSWILESPRRGQKQFACQILVASSADNLNNDLGDLWDSGKMLSDRNVNIVYGGQPLASNRKYFWKVRCWNKPGVPGRLENEQFYDSEILAAMRSELVSEYSSPASFTTGLFNENDWKGKWIAGAEEASSPLLRKEFYLKDQIRRAVVYVSGLGYYEMYINGRKVGDHLLDPATTYYDDDMSLGIGSRVLYVGYDITEQLKQGQNALGIMLGNGWYSAEDDIPPSPSHRTPYDSQPVLILQMNIELTSGENIQIVSDESFRTTAGPILYNDYSNGERYDSRLEKSGWSGAGYKDSHWSAARAVKGPRGKLVAQTMPAIKVTNALKPVRILNPEQNVYVFDFGQAFTGWCSLKAQGAKGTEVTLKYGMQVYEDGSLDNRSNWYDKGYYKHIARQTDSYILKGKGMEEWEPRFTLHGFRYVEVRGFPGEPTLESLEGHQVHSSVDESGEFFCSDSLVNQIHSNIRYTLLSSLQGYPQDAADRSERVGWLGDLNIAQDYNVNFDMAGFWTKWLNDLHDSQKPSGQMPFITPIHWRKTFDTYNDIPVWQGVYPVLCWFTYLYYDDESVMVEHYESMKKLVDYFSRELAVNHIISIGLGDHMEPQPDGTTSEAPLNTPAELTSTAWYYFITWIVAQAAEISGREDDHEHYSRLAEEIKDAFNNRFLDKETNQYSSGSQTSNAVPLYLRMVPDESIEAVVRNIVDDIMVHHNGHLSTGFLGVDALSQVLPEYGAADALFKAVKQRTFPGWGYMISKGATTVWETWDGTSHSYNMKLLCGIDKFFYQALAGIKLTAPGYREFNIKPCMAGDLTFIKAKIKTVRGPVEVFWEKGDTSFQMKVMVPNNTAARISLPKIGLSDIQVRELETVVWSNGSYVKGNAGISGATESEDYITFEIGSGYYVFRLTGAKVIK